MCWASESAPCALSHAESATQQRDPAARDSAFLDNRTRAFEHLKGIRTKNDDQKTGVEIVRKALSWPARQIAINAGEDGFVILGKILEKDQYAYGFDSQTGEYVNLISTGIIDPTEVVRVASQNAASIAALLIATETMVAEVRKKNQGGSRPTWRARAQSPAAYAAVVSQRVEIYTDNPRISHPPGYHHRPERDASENQSPVIRADSPGSTRASAEASEESKPGRDLS
jgi:hypothetical protein